MQSHLAGWDDTIVAPATPPGHSAIAVVRLSGTRAIDIVNTMFPAKDLSRQNSHTLHVGMLYDEKKELDEVVISIYRKPRSYTGEDVVEISCHGAPFIVQEILSACIKRGARPARPGEFTLRAFMNKKMDLAQAEAVADLIASQSEASKNTALKQMRGGFSKELNQLREQLLQFSSLMELELDFSQEDVEFADRTAFYELLNQIEHKVKRLADSFQHGNVIKNGVSVVIAGKPNTGKSTLLNALLNENRAIVSDIPGTTRDTIEEILNIDGILFRLIDTAGIRSHTTDIIESMGIEKTFEKVKKANLVLYLINAEEEAHEIAESLSTYETMNPQIISVVNKTDVIGEETARIKFKLLKNPVFISAKYNINLEQLKKAMKEKTIGKENFAEDVVITNARHFSALEEILKSLKDVKAGLEKNLPTDLITIDIRRCLHYLGEITGSISTEDQLDFIFSRFCIGK
ncbi:MAG: tRNA uridine-5-carboxymethylaminomethyl(34) synthesis GTPase MnmE [Chitinophagaceae bacterium]|nr:tRNA uridine-5-carboxymethylaminomethyl(34) synthesis GTPase MnmE [Chitinophagaceae bacterium]